MYEYLKRRHTLSNICINKYIYLLSCKYISIQYVVWLSYIDIDMIFYMQRYEYIIFILPEIYLYIYILEYYFDVFVYNLVNKIVYQHTIQHKF